jgi:cell division protein FtsW
MDAIDQAIDFDMVFLLTTLMLLVLGTIMIFSSSYFISKENSGSSLAMTIKHIAHLGLGVVVMGIIIRTDYRKFNNRKFVMPLLAFGILCCALCFIPGIGVMGGHARRWVRLGITLQASEVAKISLVFYLAYYLSKKNRRIEDFAYGVMPLLAIVCLSSGLVFLEPDFGTALIIGMWAMFILFIAGMQLKHLAGLFGVGVPLVIILMILEPYRRARLTAFMHPWEDMQGISYQIVQSMVAFANGGFTGSGLGEGTQKLFFLPAPHTDFIFSVLAEELGFMGVAFVLVLFGIWIWRGITIALATNDSFGFYLSISAISIVAIQAIVNMSVSMSLFPTTGVTLPFFSYGGSSLMTVFITSGLVLSVSRGARV